MRCGAPVKELYKRSADQISFCAEAAFLRGEQETDWKNFMAVVFYQKNDLHSVYHTDRLWFIPWSWRADHRKHNRKDRK